MPRSAKTFPLLFSALMGFFVLVVMLVLPFFVETFGLSQAAVDEVNILLGCSDALLRFLLEGVQNVNRLLKAGRIGGAPRIAGMVCDNFKHRSSTKTFQRLCRGVGLP